MRAYLSRHVIDGDMVNEFKNFAVRRSFEAGGYLLFLLAGLGFLALVGWHVDDASLTYATAAPVQNYLGFMGSAFADLSLQMWGFAVLAFLLPLVAWGWRLVTRRGLSHEKIRLAAWIISPIFLSGAFSSLPKLQAWPLPTGLGGAMGDGMLSLASIPLQGFLSQGINIAAGLTLFVAGSFSLIYATALLSKPVERDEMDDEAITSGIAVFGMMAHLFCALRGFVTRKRAALSHRETMQQAAYAERIRHEPRFDEAGARIMPQAPTTRAPVSQTRIEPSTRELRRGKREVAEQQTSWLSDGDFTLPPLNLLAQPKRGTVVRPDEESLEQNVKMLESVLDDFGIKGEIIHVRPGPVVTLYELQPAPGIKSSRVVGLADDIARSMSAISTRVAVIPGRNVIGIELPNARREMVYLRELLASKDFEDVKGHLPLCLGKTIGGEPVITDLAKMPHLLIAGTTGSGKSVAINTMILSLLYRLSPDQCKLIMIDPKMLELSVYDGIPHLLSPVVTDPKKAVVALEMDSARNGRALPQNVQARRSQYRRLQCARPAGC